ncbi:MAG: amidohydrolase, partial [Eubacterium sp.]|nr:amidohydrolase [Eubacterium sp.]
MIIDAHTHLWKMQNGRVDGKPVYALENGRSNFGGEIRQMMPPYMLNGENTAEMLISNMDYAGVNAAVMTQEEIDGNQDEYLLSAKEKYPERLKICSLYEENKPYRLDGFDGIKICAGRLPTQDLTKHYSVFEQAYKNNKFVSIDLADGDLQTASLREIIEQLPDLKIAIGHFGMVTTNGWKEQIKLAQNKNVYIESGG